MGDVADEARRDGAGMEPASVIHSPDPRLDQQGRRRRSRQAVELSDHGMEKHRAELTRHCARILGSSNEAEDAVQETLMRAWHGFAGFDGRGPVRAWLYRIATNVCFDMCREPQRRARPLDLGAAPLADEKGRAAPGANSWIQPLPGRAAPSAGRDPADVAAARDAVRLAFVAVLRQLPARQRAVLILRDVLRWSAEEVAELLGTTVAAVNSALQRARVTLFQRNMAAAGATALMDAEQQRLLCRYVDAFERYDVASLISLVQQDAACSRRRDASTRGESPVRATVGV